jgi:GNAT superfamily N-acetyltransferase
LVRYPSRCGKLILSPWADDRGVGGRCLERKRSVGAAIYRQRYEIYVEEMTRYASIADHTNRWLVEEIDERSRLYYAVREGSLVGSIRLTLGLDGGLSDALIDKYSLAPFLEEVPADRIIVGERFMVEPAYRGTDVLFQMFTTYVQLVNESRIELMIGDCEPHLLNVYQALGFRPYAERNINSPDAGYLIPLVVVAEDFEYVKGLHSPLSGVMTDFGDDRRIPACVDRLVNPPSGVTSERLVDIATYWSKVYSSLEEVEASRTSIFDGLDENQAQKCLVKSTIIDCQAGDRILKKGNTAQNLYVLLDGVVEVRDGDELLAVITPGEVFGEMAFLLARPRSADAVAATDTTRVLSLSESSLRGLISDEPAVAATLLLNISRMLCWRLAKDE